MPDGQECRATDGILLIRLRRIYFSKHFCPEWTLTCMISMELTRTDVVFSRITMVLFMCRSKHSRNDLKLHGATFQKIRKISAKDEGQGAHRLSTRVGACPLPHGYPVASPTTTPPPYIEFRGEKNQREKIIAFYDTEPPPSPKTSREG